MTEFIFDILVKSIHTKVKQEEIKKEREKLKQSSTYGSYFESYYPRSNIFTLTQVKINVSSENANELGIAMNKAWNICHEISEGNTEGKKYFHENKDFDYEIIPKLTRFVVDEIVATTYKGDGDHD